MIALPFVAGSVHDTSIFAPFITVVGAAGASGACVKIDPLITSDSADVPAAFVAVSLAKTESARVKLKGPAKKTVFGMLQLLFARIVASEPLQLVSSVSNELSDFLKDIV